MLALALGGSAARADNSTVTPIEPIELQSVELLDADQVYNTYVTYSDPDPTAKQQTLQYLLWLYWFLGGNPTELDPTWVPPVQPVS